MPETKTYAAIVKRHNPVINLMDLFEDEEIARKFVNHDEEIFIVEIKPVERCKPVTAYVTR